VSHPPYAELQVSSNYSFLRGASHPEELVLSAAALGHAAIAITDRNSLSGVVRAHSAAKKAGIKLIVGVRLDLTDAPSLLCYPTDRAAYGRLARLLTVGKRRAPKGECQFGLTDVLAHGEGQIIIVLPPVESDTLKTLRKHFKKRIYLSVKQNYIGDDIPRMKALGELALECRVPLVATNDVHAHTASRRPLQDVLCCIREHCTIHEAGFRLHANAERRLKPPEEMARLFRDFPKAIGRTMEITDACTFSLDELRYEYPIDPVPDGRTPQDELVRLAWAGADDYFPDGPPPKVRAQIEHELELIGELDYAPYFLTVHDIVHFARSRGILCQGRGSAANSAVCYCLGITAVDPSRIDLLFERFISAERGEPPDIDVDFEHERREEVIQYIYGKYGRERSGMTATVITYRTKSALREVGKAMGLSDDTIVALQGASWRRSWDEIEDNDIRENGLDPNDKTIRMVMELAGELRGFPRHLSQHTGGMVMTKGPLCEVVPIANAAMQDRTVIEWDKNDLDALGILKVDVLGLGMLTCVRKAFELIERHHGRKLTLASVPAEDAAVYDMLCQGDSVGVFQVESRAQMAMLPRLKPRSFYDLVIEVAIVRPGPIQGDMVHPYLRRRQGIESVEFPSKELEQVLGKTLGIPLFQEQAMKIAIVGAGFSPSEADALRRAMATFRHFGEIHAFRTRFIDGMLARGYEHDFAERCFKQIEGFADYGFPESHAASFALLVYVSSWIKRHYPAAFAAALLNSQPMGFYAPAQIIRDARDHGVKARPADVNLSDWDYTLEGKDAAIRLGLRQIKGLAERDAEALLDARGAGYSSAHEIWRRAGLGRSALETLARADAFGSIGLDRRAALWAVRGLGDAPLPLFAAANARENSREAAVSLPKMAATEQVADDYRALRLSLKGHPVGLMRGHLESQNFMPCVHLRNLAHGKPARVAGLVVTRQRPGSAKGVIFVTLEDETGIANLVIYASIFERFRKITLGAGLLGVQGRVQREGIVIHVTADKLFDLTSVHMPIKTKSRDFH
jgi:error-prone DNA polymerase